MKYWYVAYNATTKRFEVQQPPTTIYDPLHTMTNEDWAEFFTTQRKAEAEAKRRNGGE